MILDGDLKDGDYGIYKDLGNGWYERIEKKNINDLDFFIQYVVSYMKNGKWYRDSERHQNIKTVTKRLNELKRKGKYQDYKIVYRKISKWFDLGDDK